MALYLRRLFLLLQAFFLRSISALIATRLSDPFSRYSTFSANTCRAIFRFWLLDRVSWHLTTMPVGLCFNCTAEEVLFCRVLVSSMLLSK